MDQLVQRILGKTAAILVALLVFCLHVYFAMMIGVKPAMAAEKSASVSVNVAADSKDKGAASVTVVETKDAADEKQSEDATEADLKGGVSIKINGEDGISITGSQKLVDQLKALEEKIEDKLEASEVYKDPDTVVYKTLENVLVPIVFFLVAFGFAGYVIYSKHKTRQQLLETIRTMAQNGQTIPPEMLSQLHGNSQWNLSAVNYSNPSATQGLKYVFIGVGIAGFLLLKDFGFSGSSFGFIFLVMGAYHLTKSHLAQKQMETQKSKADGSESVTSTTTPS